MQVHSLSLESFSEDEISLIAIHTSLEDYRLAYFLNTYLKTKFTKFRATQTTTKTRKQPLFPMYNYTDSSYEIEWALVANTLINDEQKNNNELLLFTESIMYFIPEMKKNRLCIKNFWRIGKRVS